MQALHLGLRYEPCVTGDFREEPAYRIQAPVVNAAREHLSRPGHEVCNHAPSVRQVIHGRNAVLEAARAGRVIKVYRADGLGHDPRLDELARLVPVEVVPKNRLDSLAPGVNQDVAAALKPLRERTPDERRKANESHIDALESLLDQQHLAAT